MSANLSVCTISLNHTYFSNIKLLMVALPFPRSHIIDNSIAPHMGHSISFTDPEARLANYQTNLTFVVKTVREVRVGINILAACDNGSEPLGEYNRVGGSCSKIRQTA